MSLDIREAHLSEEPSKLNKQPKKLPRFLGRPGLMLTRISLAALILTSPGAMSACSDPGDLTTDYTIPTQNPELFLEEHEDFASQPAVLSNFYLNLGQVFKEGDSTYQDRNFLPRTGVIQYLSNEPFAESSGSERAFIRTDDKKIIKVTKVESKRAGDALGGRSPLGYENNRVIEFEVEKYATNLRAFLDKEVIIYEQDANGEMLKLRLVPLSEPEVPHPTDRI